MPSTIVTPNMNLVVPVPGVEPGPQYAADLNASLTLIDQHNHTPGYGVLIPPTGLNINADLPINNNNLTLVRSLRFDVQGAPLSLVTDLSCLYSVTETGSNGDLWYNDAAGNHIQITKTGAVLATISALISGSNEASFVANQLVVNSIQSNGTPANVVMGSALLGNNATGTKFLTLQPPNAMAASYTVTAPAPNALSQTAVLTYDTSNNILATTSLASLSNGAVSGDIKMTGATALQTGWLACDGTSYLRATYPALFAAIGTAYGTADGTHFNVPDMRGMFPRGVDPVGTNDPDRLGRTENNPGGNTGASIGSQQPWQFQDHSHGVTFTGIGGAVTQIVGSGSGFTGSGNTNGASSGSVSNAQTNPINVYVNFIIKI